MLLACCLSGIVVHLSGCTASWRAPVETRGSRAPTPKPVRGTLRVDEYRVQRGDTLYGIAWQRGSITALSPRGTVYVPVSYFSRADASPRASCHKTSTTRINDRGTTNGQSGKAAAAQARSRTFTCAKTRLELACSRPGRIVVQSRRSTA